MASARSRAAPAAARDREARPGQLGRPAEVEQAGGLAKIDMVLRLEREGGRSADAPDLDSELLGVAVGGRVVRQVRDAQEQVAQLALDPFLAGLDLADLVLQLAGALLELADVAALLGRLLDLARHSLGLCPQLVGRADVLVPARLEGLQLGQVQGVTATSEPTNRVGTHVDQGAGIMHEEDPSDPASGMGIRNRR